ncbi:hypothetical protein SAMN06297129_1942 [Pseudooceanicola antarcticus]|uniref:Uncharacterized protein n=1 Tax=Pseudooceanicola antarcticus TaxID=1247613 RepID=A0A285ISW7_9RHOB|nr:hypothetical protein [Pseudooceanicola antarcticus]PJE31903.1 hypothetical protein CVM39_02040 [Pseudooceanicola antarcticus]SNY50777.1 hypothetical protein SAMN06297129_1942 [Pseudooceanicola antarcticus]
MQAFGYALLQVTTPGRIAALPQKGPVSNVFLSVDSVKERLGEAVVARNDRGSCRDLAEFRAAMQRKGVSATHFQDGMRGGSWARHREMVAIA